MCAEVAAVVDSWAKIPGRKKDKLTEVGQALPAPLHCALCSFEYSACYWWFFAGCGYRLMIIYGSIYLWHINVF